jgi:hypothetical protein
MRTAIRRDHIIDLVAGNRHPGTVHLDFVVVADHATLGRPTSSIKLQDEPPVTSFEGRVEALMPFIVAYCAEPISKSPEEDNEASELYEAEEVLGVVFPTDEDAALPLNPSKEALHEPASHIAA